MKLSAIDIGSNSVRLLLWADGSSVLKKLRTTRLGEGLSVSGSLKKEAMVRTSEAVRDFCKEAKDWGAEKVFAFATAAARRAENGQEFARMAENISGIPIEIISGEEEARIGLYGALEGKDGGIIDVGGASSEVTVSHKGKIIFAVSADLGAVRLKDLCGEDKDKMFSVISEQIKIFENVPKMPMVAIGGTATSIVALEKELAVYDSKIVHGTKMSYDCVRGWADKLLAMSQAERLSLIGMEKSRADILGGGALLLSEIMKKIGAEEITISEKDNLEGYLLTRIEGAL